MSETPLRNLDLLETAAFHLQRAIDSADSLVPVTITRAIADAKIAATLLQLREAEQLEAPPYVSALSAHVRGSEGFALDVIERCLREYKSAEFYDRATATELVERIIEALKEAGRTI